MGFQQECQCHYHMEVVMCSAGRASSAYTIPAQSHLMPGATACLLTILLSSHGSWGASKKKTELVIFSHCGWECWDCHPNISSNLGIVDCLTIPTFRGSGLPSQSSRQKPAKRGRAAHRRRVGAVARLLPAHRGYQVCRSPSARMHGSGEGKLLQTMHGETAIALPVHC